MANLEHITNLSDETMEIMCEIRLCFIGLHQNVDQLGKSRELSIALTDIENALMWTMKHLAIKDKEKKENDRIHEDFNVLKSLDLTNL